MIAKSDSGDLSNSKAMRFVLMTFWTTIYDKEDKADQNTSNIMSPCNVDIKTKIIVL